jgi:protein phosphatase 1G
VACDGIWDCTTNEEVCVYIREQKEKHNVKDNELSKIVSNLFEEILAVNVEQGTGTDNMTCIIAQFKK